jgi:transposase
VDARHEYVPQACAHCGKAFPPDLPLEARAWVHQVLELPEIRPQVSEHVRRACRCPACGKRTWAPLPPGVPPSGAGPRLHAAVALLTGQGRMSRRRLQECQAELFHLPLALGTVAKIERRVSDALADAYATVTQAVRRAPVVHSDETRWREGKQHPWLWVLATPHCCLLQLTDQRNRDAFTALLGEDLPHRVLVSDRYGVYGHLAPERHGYCWAHLDRDFLAVAQSGDPLSFLGSYCLEEVDALFAAWQRFRRGELERVELREALRPVQERLRTWLCWGAEGGGKKLAGFFGNLLEQWESLWVFAHQEGVEPTNNLAERLLRPAVLWRKVSYGTQGEAGRRYVERMLTVTGTLTLQGRRLFPFLLASCQAALGACTAPSLVEEARTLPLEADAFWWRAKTAATPHLTLPP